MSDAPKRFTCTDYCPAAELNAELEAINAELEKVASYSLLKQNEKLKAENARLREALSEIREVYTGSEGIPQPETAAEAYVLRLVEQMYEVAVKAIKGGSDD